MTRSAIPGESLQECGATETECAFLVTGRKVDIRNGKRRVSWVGQRIELNAMDSQQFLDWLERKLQDAGVEKVVPDEDVLAVAYRQLQRVAKMEQVLKAAMEEPEAETPVPEALGEQIRERITETDASWDAALWDLVSEDEAGDEDDGKAPVPQ